MREPKEYISHAVELWAARQPELADDVIDVIEHLRELETERLAGWVVKS
jgi:hypothetical protein